MDNWNKIDLSNEMPEKGELCWIYTIEGEVEIDIFDGDWWVNQCYGGVTHWQSIPKPPKPKNV